MIIFHDLQEMTRKMDKKTSNRIKNTESNSSVNLEKKLLYDEREMLRNKEERKSCILVFLSGIGILVILYLFIRLYIAVGDYIFNSSIFWSIAIIGFIGVALYYLFLIGCYIFNSFGEAKKTGGISIIVLTVFFILMAIVITIMSRCT